MTVDVGQFNLLKRLQCFDRRCDTLAKWLLNANAERQLLLAGCNHHWADGRSSLGEGWCAICHAPGANPCQPS